MSNQDLNELRDINKQLEELQNQKRIIQQKLQDENDMMMVENHLFSQPKIFLISKSILITKKMKSHSTIIIGISLKQK